MSAAGTNRAAISAFARMASSGFVGAGVVDRALRDWDYARGSADSVSVPDLPELRERSSALVRNEPLADGWLQTERDSVVGTGLRPQSVPNHTSLGVPPAEAKAKAREMEAIWDLSKDRLDIERTLDWQQMLEVAFMAPLERGDLLSVRRWRRYAGDPLGTKVQLVEADRVSNPNRRWDTTTLRQGVERDADGAPVAYHVANRHEQDLRDFRPLTWTRVPAFGAATGEPMAILHFRRRRLGQTRGVPALASVIGHFKKLGRYTDAEIMAALVNAMFTVLLEDHGSGAVDLPMTAEDDEGGAAGAGEVSLGSGSVVELPSGKRATVANAARPSAAFGPFVDAVLMQTATGLGLPVSLFTKRFLNSYSAARADLLEAWRHFYGWREWLAGSFCRPLWGWVQSEAVSAGLVDLPGFFDNPLRRAAWLATEWVGDAPGQIDELKEAKAAEVRIKNGFSSLRREVPQMTGGDWERVHEERTEEVMRRRADGLEEGLLDDDPPANKLIEESDQQEEAVHGS